MTCIYWGNFSFFLDGSISCNLLNMFGPIFALDFQMSNNFICSVKKTDSLVCPQAVLMHFISNRIKTNERHSLRGGSTCSREQDKIVYSH